MGKKGSWFSAIKRVFTHSSKEKPTDGEKKKGKGILRRGENKSFNISLFRGPSSIEKILSEADQLFIRPPPTSPGYRQKEPAFLERPTSSRTASSPKATSPRVSSSRVLSPKSHSPRAVSPKGDPSRPSAPPRAVSAKGDPSGPTAPPRAVSATGDPSGPSAPPRAVPAKDDSSRPNVPLKAVSPKGDPSRPNAPPGPLQAKGDSTRPNAPPTAVSPKDDSSRVSAPPRADSPEGGSSMPNAPPRAYDLRASSSKTAAVTKVTQGRKEISYVQKPEPTLRDQHVSATRIQAAYRGYQAKRSFRALKGLVRLQGVVRGQNVKRQTMSALKQMQLLVKVQTQIQSRRIQMSQSSASKDKFKNKETESTLSKWTQMSQVGNNEDWNNSVLTKEEVEARSRKKVEAVMKRERSVAYAYSHQLHKFNPKSAQTPLDSRSNGYPWWWNWLERQLPSTTSQSQTATKNLVFTPPRAMSEYRQSPRHHTSNNNHKHFPFDNNNEVHTPRSSRSSIPIRSKQFQSPNSTPNATRFAPKPRSTTGYSVRDILLKDDDSLMSCPPFSVPNYMTPTVSAKAKARAYSNPKERFPMSTPGNDSKRRFSYPSSIGETSVDSAVSMPTLVGRKPFNRFV